MAAGAVFRVRRPSVFISTSRELRRGSWRPLYDVILEAVGVLIPGKAPNMPEDLEEGYMKVALLPFHSMGIPEQPTPDQSFTLHMNHDLPIR